MRNKVTSVMYRGAQITLDSWGDDTYAVSIYDEHGEGDYGIINMHGLSYKSAIQEGQLFIDDIRNEVQE